MTIEGIAGAQRPPTSTPPAPVKAAEGAPSEEASESSAEKAREAALAQEGKGASANLIA